MNCTAPRHDTASAYHYGCRCPAARHAQYLYAKRRKLGINPPSAIDGTGSRRRLRGLVAIGWTAPLIAQHLGVDQAQVTRWYHVKRITPASAAKIRAVYDQLWHTPGPSQKSRARAAAAGWPSPLAWDDDTIDDPAAEPDRVGQVVEPADDVDMVAVREFVAGWNVTLTAAEKLRVVQVLFDQGWTDTQLGKRFGLSQDWACVFRKRHGIRRTKAAA
jgi:hypothetical protein